MRWDQCYTEPEMPPHLSLLLGLLLGGGELLPQGAELAVGGAVGSGQAAGEKRGPFLGLGGNAARLPQLHL